MIDWEKEEASLPNGWLSRYDIETLYKGIKESKKGDVYLEIGVNRGRSLAFAKKYFKGDVYGVDVVSIEDSGGEPIPGTNFILGDSLEVKWKLPINVLFIDGEHRYDRVKGEWEKYSPFVVKGGWVFFHDSDDTSPEVFKFTKELGAVQHPDQRCSMAYIRL